mmetsp:Transcript_19969/g.27933  ORF Transcript_19969/g.27933 Transcript_19969/m.27933 type:complete len:219 (+) Transcript_19969:385-1041(+)
MSVACFLLVLLSTRMWNSTSSPHFRRTPARMSVVPKRRLSNPVSGAVMEITPLSSSSPLRGNRALLSSFSTMPRYLSSDCVVNEMDPFGKPRTRTAHSLLARSSLATENSTSIPLVISWSRCKSTTSRKWKYRDRGESAQRMKPKLSLTEWTIPNSLTPPKRTRSTLAALRSWFLLLMTTSNSTSSWTLRGTRGSSRSLERKGKDSTSPVAFLNSTSP